MTDPIHLSLVEAATAIRARKLSSRELAEACIARLERLQPILNCFISPDPEHALAAADQADIALAQDEEIGPLHGVPLAHKDMYYRAGIVSTCGSRIRKDFKPDHTATVVARLTAAGALHLGGLNMAEFAFGPTGHNVHWGNCATIRGIRTISPGDRQVVPAPPSAAGSSLALSARIPVGPFACLPPRAV